MHQLMNLPLFDYKQLIFEHIGQPRLSVHTSILMLHYIEETAEGPIPQKMHSALENYAVWKQEFLSINKKIFNQINCPDRPKFLSSYRSLIIKYLLRSEFYDWRIFTGSRPLANRPMITLKDNGLCYCRPIKYLI